jgi:hypothetical protein
MKSNEAFKVIISDVNSKFGAPMGRMNRGKIDDSKRLFDRQVPLDSGAYDKGGAYWGLPNNLRVRYHSDLSFVEFYRK